MKMNVVNIIKLVLLAILLFMIIPGCARKVPVADLPEGYTILHVGKADPAIPIAWHPDGQQYAFSGGKLIVGKLGETARTVIAKAPSAIAWSPTGAFLAASFAGKETSTVKIFGSDLTEFAEASVSGSLRDLAWVSDDELLLATINVQRFSFGGNYKVLLYRWHQNKEMTHEVLADTSPLKSNLDAMGDSIFESVHLQISPYRDEIIFTRLLTPPNVDMHYQLVVRHLASGSEKIMAKLPYGSTGGRYLQLEDKLFYSDGRYQSIQRSIWGTEAYESYQHGLLLEISPGGRYKLIDGKLLSDRDIVFTIDRPGRAAFSPDGSKLFFSSGRDLYLLLPLEDFPVKRVVVSPRLLELRRWRSEGLITPQEYVKHSRTLHNK